MQSDDREAFRTVIEDLCTAFDRPCGDDRVRVFWETLKHLHLADVRRAAESFRRNGRRMPTPKDLMPERATAPAPRPVEEAEKFSKYAVAANRILLTLAYQDTRRGFKPIATYPPLARGTHALQTPSDDSLLKKLLAVKREYVGMAEADDANGEPWPAGEFDALCQDGFEGLLATHSSITAATAAKD